jgi:anti-anti-sigma regulatory factor
MIIDRSKQDARSTKARRARPGGLQAVQSLEPIYIEVERSGDWMPAEELRKAALAASGESKDVTVNLGKVDHLDASALQILLALDAEQKRQGRHLHLANASAHLRQWFEYAGVAECFLMNGPENDE